MKKKNGGEKNIFERIGSPISVAIRTRKLKHILDIIQEMKSSFLYVCEYTYS